MIISVRGKMTRLYIVPARPLHPKAIRFEMETEPEGSKERIHTADVMLTKEQVATLAKMMEI